MPKPRQPPQLPPTARRGLLLLAAAGAIVVAWLIVPTAHRPSPATGASPAAANRNPPQADRAAPRTPEPLNVATAAEAPMDPLDDPSSAASAHAAIAAELSLVGVRCRIPSGLPLYPPVGNFRARLQDGWYSDIMQALSGEYPVEVRFPDPDAGGDALRTRVAYVVSWSAERWGETVQCTIHEPDFGTVAVSVTRDDGRPANRVHVVACGGGGYTVDGKIDVGYLVPTESCPVHVLDHTDGARCAARDNIRVAPGQRTHIALQLRCDEPGEPAYDDVFNAFLADVRSELRGQADYTIDPAVELAMFQRLRSDLDDGAPGAELLDALIDHRAMLVHEKARSKACLEGIRSPDPEVRAFAEAEFCTF